MYFKVSRANGSTLPELNVVLNLPGLHNVRNALAAIAVAVELGVPDQAVLEALEQFKGVGRRFQHHGQLKATAGGEFTLIEDYGHHPAELSVTIDAARGAYPGQRLVLAFQPHRYTRTRDCFEDFVRVLQKADRVILTQVYAAGEKPIVAADSKALMRGLRVAGFENVIFAEQLDDVVHHIVKDAQDGDVLMCMGAGSIGQVPLKVLSAVQSRDAQEVSLNQGEIVQGASE
jgi:UDP-N-acetylmuramate--alanine ligase